MWVSRQSRTQLGIFFRNGKSCRREAGGRNCRNAIYGFVKIAFGIITWTP